MSSHERWLHTSSTGPCAGGVPCTTRRMPSSVEHALRPIAARAASRSRRRQPRKPEADGPPAADARAPARAAASGRRTGRASCGASARLSRRRTRPPTSVQRARPAQRIAARTACACPGCAAPRAAPAIRSRDRRRRGRPTPPFDQPAALACGAQQAAPAPARHAPRARASGRRRSARPTAAPAAAAVRARWRPASLSAKGSVLASASTGVWSDTSASMVPSASAGRQRIAVALLAQRRVQARAAVEVADVGVGQVQRVDADVAGQRQAFGLGRAHQRHAGRAATGGTGARARRWRASVRRW